MYEEGDKGNNTKSYKRMNCISAKTHRVFIGVMFDSSVRRKRLIVLRDIKKEYALGNEITYALKGVSFDIAEGEFISIIGKSGSGKSTLMNILGGLDVQTSGIFLLKGKAFFEMSEDQKASFRNKELGFVFQKFNLLRNLTALDNVALPLIYQGIGKRKAKEMAVEALVKMHLGSKVNHTPEQLSGGQQQRVAIARAIVTKPSVILADEPTGNLDSESSEMVMEILKELHKSGNTLVVITHDNAVARQAQRVVELKDGVLISDKKTTS